MTFPGFPPQAMDFLRDLRANNERVWFAAHKQVYENAIQGPTSAFVDAITPELEALTGASVTAKVFRLHRDIRFSKDKSPYNAHLHIGFHNGERGGLYFGLEPERLHLGAGAFMFEGPALDHYRAAAADDRDGRKLADLLASLAADGYRIDPPALKRVPAPYPPDHPRGDLLRRKGVTAWREVSDRCVIEGPALLDATLAAFQRLAPLNAWIAAVIDSG
jgi:uncharacterized protein (TIGR02453 family)